MKTQHNIGRRIAAVICICLTLAATIPSMAFGPVSGFTGGACQTDLLESQTLSNADAWGYAIAIACRQTQDLSYADVRAGECAQVASAGYNLPNLCCKAAISLDYFRENDLHFNSPLIKFRQSSSDHSTEG